MCHLIFEGFLDQPEEVALFFTITLIPILHNCIVTYLFVFFPFLECKLIKICIYPTPRSEDSRVLPVPPNYASITLQKIEKKNSQNDMPVKKMQHV